MSNNGARIVLDRQDGNVWRWTATIHGTQYVGKTISVSPAKAAEAAELEMVRIETERVYRAGTLPRHIVN